MVGPQEGENSIVIFRFIEVSKVDRCAGYGFLLVSPTQEGYTQGGLVLPSLATKAALATCLSSFFPVREKEGERSFDFTLQRTLPDIDFPFPFPSSFSCLR